MTVNTNIELGPIDSHYGGKPVDTVKIKADNYYGYATINVSDFDPAKHQLFGTDEGKEHRNGEKGTQGDGRHRSGPQQQRSATEPGGSAGDNQPDGGHVGGGSEPVGNADDGGTAGSASERGKRSGRYTGKTGEAD